MVAGWSRFAWQFPNRARTHTQGKTLKHVHNMFCVMPSCAADNPNGIVFLKKWKECPVALDDISRSHKVWAPFPLGLGIVAWRNLGNKCRSPLLANSICTETLQRQHLALVSTRYQRGRRRREGADMIGSNAVLLPLLTDRTRRRERESWGLEVDENRFSRPLHLRYQSARKRERDIPLLPPMPFYMEMWNKDDGEKRKKKTFLTFSGRVLWIFLVPCLFFPSTILYTSIPLFCSNTLSSCRDVTGKPIAILAHTSIRLFRQKKTSWRGYVLCELPDSCYFFFFFFFPRHDGACVKATRRMKRRRFGRASTTIQSAKSFYFAERETGYKRASTWVIIAEVTYSTW